MTEGRPKNERKRPDPLEGHRDRLGRFLKGKPGGPGRPKGFDFRKVIAEKAEEHDVDLKEALWLIFESLLGKNLSDGDVQAAKLIIDKLCTADPSILEVRDMSHQERAHRVKALLAASRKRGEEEEGTPDAE